MYFLCRHPERWPELLAADKEVILDPDVIPQRITSNEDCWVVHTYLRLKQLGEDVHFTTRLPAGKICVVSGLDLAIRDLPLHTFIVACRSDGAFPALGDVVVQQNEVQASTGNSLYIPHWPQPGLIWRTPDRMNRMEVLCFKGSIVNLHETFRSESFRRELAALGVTLQVDDLEGAQQLNWHDYRAVDAVLAVRNLTVADALTKPASKLVNAWAAGVPALLGPEPAFQQLRQSSLDYFEVVQPRHVLDAIRALRAQPELFNSMVVNGHARQQTFSTEAIGRRWIAALGGPVADRYRAWRDAGALQRYWQFFNRGLAHKRSFADAAYLREHGPRLITG